MNYENYLRSYHPQAGNTFTTKTLKSVLEVMIAFYQVHLKWFWVADCKFEPTCSCYAMDCVSKHSPGKAIYMIGRRLIKCHPLSDGGYDPVENTRFEGKA